MTRVPLTNSSVTDTRCRRQTMAAVVADPADGQRFRLTRVPVPNPREDQVLIAVAATTVISSELASLDGVSMADLPLVLGNDFVGTVVEAPGEHFAPGTRVLGAYGGYGYTRDGAWAEYVCVDAQDAWPIVSGLDSTTIAAIPGSFTAASGCLDAIGPVDGRTLLIRGGTAGVGLAIATLASAAGATVVATTRHPGKVRPLLEHGVDHVLLDDDSLEQQLHALLPGGADLAAELLGVRSLHKTLRLVRPGGTVCLTGLLGDQAASRSTGVREDRALLSFPHPMELIPPTVRLTVGGVAGNTRTRAKVQDWVVGLESGRYRMPIDSIFGLDDMASALSRRDRADTFGKVVISVSSRSFSPEQFDRAERRD